MSQPSGLNCNSSVHAVYGLLKLKFAHESLAAAVVSKLKPTPSYWLELKYNVVNK